MAFPSELRTSYFVAPSGYVVLEVFISSFTSSPSVSTLGQASAYRAASVLELIKGVSENNTERVIMG